MANAVEPGDGRFLDVDGRHRTHRTQPVVLLTGALGSVAEVRRVRLSDQRVEPMKTTVVHGRPATGEQARGAKMTMATAALAGSKPRQGALTVARQGEYRPPVPIARSTSRLPIFR